MADVAPVTTASRVLRPAIVIPALALVAIGGFGGYYVAYQTSVGGLGGAIGGGIGIVGIGLATLLAVLAGAVTGWLGTSAGRRLASAAASAALVLAGAFSGATATGALGLGYHEPVVLHSTGTATLTVPGTGELDPAPAATADCTSVPDGPAVEGVSVVHAGSIQGARVLVSLGLSGPKGNESITIDIGGEAMPDGQIAPVWGGSATIAQWSDDGRSGTATFRNLGISNPADKGLPGESPLGISGSWPATLTGSLDWECAPLT